MWQKSKAVFVDSHDELFPLYYGNTYPHVTAHNKGVISGDFLSCFLLVML